MKAFSLVPCARAVRVGIWARLVRTWPAAHDGRVCMCTVFNEYVRALVASRFWRTSVLC